MPRKHSNLSVASQPNDLVLDPFSGSATTGIVAIESGRRFLGIEKQPHFAELSSRRLKECLTREDSEG
jgi:site-specific DNA-methyltransferase (adenine-specific)